MDAKSRKMDFFHLPIHFLDVPDLKNVDPPVSTSVNLPKKYGHRQDNRTKTEQKPNKCSLFRRVGPCYIGGINNNGKGEQI